LSARTWFAERSARRGGNVKRIIVAVAVLVTLLAIPVSSASGKSIGGCPTSASEKWELVTVESLGIDPETASGIPSLDGNGDGYTCVKPMPNFPLGSGQFVFRDNTV